jgi:hypothetical protein
VARHILARRWQEPGHVHGNSLDRGKAEKKFAYARSGIRCYGIVILVDRHVEVFSDPASTGYRSGSILTPGQLIPVVLDGTALGQIALDDVLP